MSEFASRGYAHPEVLVSTDWVESHIDDPHVRIVESNEDPLTYPAGHIPGAVEVDWTRDLNQPIRRNFLDREDFQDLMRRIGADNDKTIVLYGDKNNWWACYAFWIFKIFNVRDVRLMEGGHLKWVSEGRPVDRTHSRYDYSEYVAPTRNDTESRIFRGQLMKHLDAGKKILDVRSPQEYNGEALHMPGYLSDGALRLGRIPGSIHLHWEECVEGEFATFKSRDEILQLYTERGLRAEDELVIYCRIGKRSSHNWFVMNYLLGFPNIRMYDGAWLEWGNLVDAPIER